MIWKMALRNVDDMGSILPDLGCLIWDQIFPPRKKLFYAHGKAKIRMPQNGLKSMWNWSNLCESGVGDAGSLLGPFPNIIFFEKNSLFGPRTHTDHTPDHFRVVLVVKLAVSRASRHLRGSGCFQKHFLHKDLFQKYSLSKKI